MANFIYNVAKTRMQNGGLDLDTDTIKCLLVEGSTAGDPDHATVAAALAVHAELVCTGYTAGPGSSSRKTETITVTGDNANDRSDAVTGSQTWTALSDGSIVQKYLIYKHVSGSDDTLNIPIALIDTATGLPLTTNGSDVTRAATTLRLA
jgi:hypothetical protein